MGQAETHSLWESRMLQTNPHVIYLFLVLRLWKPF